MTTKAKTLPTLDWLTDVNVFAVNRIPAHSDHYYYESLEEALSVAPRKMRYDLNGNWKFSYSVNPDNRPVEFYKPEFNDSGWGDISVPGHIQMRGYGKPQYVNIMYPWDGHSEIRPPEIPTDHNPVGSYVKYFTVPTHFQHKPVYLSFQTNKSYLYSLTQKPSITINI